MRGVLSASKRKELYIISVTLDNEVMSELGSSDRKTDIDKFCKSCRGGSMKLTKQWLVSIIMGVAAAAVGLYLFFLKGESVSIFIIVAGALILINGFGSLFTAMRKGVTENLRRFQMIRGIAAVVVGLLAVLLPILSKTISWEVILYIIAVERALSVVLQILSISGLKKLSVPMARGVTNMGISLILVLVIFLVPNGAEQVIRVVAAAVMVYGLALVIIGIIKKPDAGNKSKNGMQEQDKAENGEPAEKESPQEGIGLKGSE